jgi:CRP-like cAMP-binding protein
MKLLDDRLVPPAGLPLLRGVPWFSVLSPVVLESLARGLREVNVPAGTVVIAEGVAGDAFYMIEAGSVTVTQQGRHLRDEGPGEYFGEIALLHDIPRTATVTATTDLVLRALDRGVFLRALSGEGLQMAGDVAATRLRNTG